MNIEPVKVKNLTQKTKDAIYNYIKTKDLNKDSKLPSEETLSQSLGVSRITVRSALNELATEGIIFRRQGKGTFVNVEALQMKAQLNPIKQFSEIIESSGYKSSIKLLEHEFIKADLIISNALKIDEGDPVVVVRKIFFADNEPCTYCVDYVPLEILNSEEDCEYLVHYDNSIFEFIKDKCGKEIAWDKVEITTTTNEKKPELVEAFNCTGKNKSFLVIKGVNFDTEDKPTVYAVEYIDTEYISFNIIRQRIM